MIADRLLDGVGVVSVGIKNDGCDYGVGVTATHPVELPSLPRELQNVVVSVVLTAEPAHHYGAASLAIGKVRRLWRRLS
ncbi:hypothetical protein BVC93_22910 [Mycobacterium sp. MS1601]|nr:hypothetical protein BVC93_22910 [Mycobacterium sp. MS1601]